MGLRLGLLAWFVAAWALAGAMIWRAIEVRASEVTPVANHAASTEVVDAATVPIEIGRRLRVVGRLLLEDEPSLDPESPKKADGDAGPPVVAPTAGSCTIQAWQDRVPIGEPGTCAEDGTFALALDRVQPGTLAVELSVPERLRGYLEVDVPRDGDVVLPAVALGLGYEINGHVIDRHGQPVAGADITARPRPDYDEQAPWRTRSDNEGAFRIDTLPVGPVSLQAAKVLHASSVMEAVAPEAGVLIVLEELVTVRGHVVAGDSVPADWAANVVVRLEGSSVWPAREQPVDADGSFAFVDLPDGVYALEAIRRDHEAPLASALVHEVTAEHLVELRLEPGVYVAVQVHDESGHAIANARVSLGDAGLGVLAKRDETGADGRVLLGPVGWGSYWLSVHADGYLAAEPMEVEVAGDSNSVTVVLRRPARIEGIVRDGAGRPVADAQVVVESDDGFDAAQQPSQRDLFRAARRESTGSLGVTRGAVPAVVQNGGESMDTGGWTNAAGRFVVDLLPGGTYRLHARHPSYGPGSVVTVHVSPSQVVRNVELSLGQGYPITGRVRDDNGQPLARVRVEIGDGVTAWTDDRGVFDAGLWRGGQELVFVKPGHVSQRLRVQARAPGVDLEVTLKLARARLSGRVVDGNGQPLDEVSVVLSRRDGVSPTMARRTDARGLFVFEGVSAGAADLRLSHDDYSTVDTEVTIAASDSLQEFELTRSHAVDVVVRDRSGSPIEGAKITGAARMATTDRHGRARVYGVPDTRSITLDVDAPDMVGTQLRVDRSQPEWFVELVAGGGVEGEVRDDIGDVLSGARVRVFAEDGSTFEARTDTRGRFRVHGVPAGDVRVVVEPPASRDDLQSAEERSDVLRGLVTRDLQIRLDRP